MSLNVWILGRTKGQGCHKGLWSTNWKSRLFWNVIQEFVRWFMSLDANPSQRCAMLGLQYQSHHPLLLLLQSWVFCTRVFVPPPHTASNSLYTQFASVSSIWHSANFTSWLLESFFPWSKTHPSWGVSISSICSCFLSPWIFALLGWGSPVPSQKLPAHPLMKYSLG